MKVRETGEKSAAGFFGLNNDTQTKSSAKIAFVEEMKKVEEKQVKQGLEDLLNDIDNLGNKLAEHRSIESLHGYKNKVKAFLSDAVKKIYKLREDIGFDRRGRHKIYSLVENVDKELDELTKIFMDKQQDKLSIVAKVDEIRGLLVDLYM